MKYAVIKTQGKQYKVKEGDLVTVDNVQDGKLNIEVLLLVSEKTVKIGKPVVSGAKIKAKVLKNFKGEKIRVAKFKAKSRYRRVVGFRPSLTQIKIEKIE